MLGSYRKAFSLTTYFTSNTSLRLSNIGAVTVTVNLRPISVIENRKVNFDAFISDKNVSYSILVALTLHSLRVATHFLKHSSM